MSKFFVGQRIKKVRGDVNIGVTARVIGHIYNIYPDATVHVRTEAPSVIQYGNDLINEPAGTEALANAGDWEPILPEGHRPSEFTTLRDLLNSLDGVHA